MRRTGAAGNCFGNSGLNEGLPNAATPLRLLRRAAVMHLHTYRDENRSRHFDLTGGRRHPWSIDLVTVTTSGMLVMGFVIAIAAFWIH